MSMGTTTEMNVLDALGVSTAIAIVMQILPPVTGIVALIFLVLRSMNEYHKWKTKGDGQHRPTDD